MIEKVSLREWPCQAVEEWITTFQHDFETKFGMNIPTSTVMGLILTDWIASKAAEASVYGQRAQRWNLIRVDAEGHILTGQELYMFLLNDYASRLLYQRG